MIDAETRVGSRPVTNVVPATRAREQLLPLRPVGIDYGVTIANMDPAVFDRLTRRRNWTLEHYERWFSHSVARLLTADAP